MPGTRLLGPGGLFLREGQGTAAQQAQRRWRGASPPGQEGFPLHYSVSRDHLFHATGRRALVLESPTCT